MKLKHVNSLKGTGTMKDDDSYSSRPFIDYLKFMLNALIMLVLFCYITANNYLNAQGFKLDEYPIGKMSPNPYCCRFIECNNPKPAEWDTVSKLPWWFQTTQETCYRAMGIVLHYYFKCMQWGIGEGIPDKDVIPFIKWFIFGLITLLSIVVMMSCVGLIFIPGWFGGLVAYRNLNARGWWYIVSALLTFCFGFVSIFPVIYEFFHLIYLFFFKQLVLAGKSDNSSNLSAEFTKRMSNMMMVFVIVAVIVAAMQLPALCACVIGGIVLLALIFTKTKSVYKSA